MQTDAALIRRHDSFDFSAAEERLASFALNLSVRLELRGLCGRNFALAHVPWGHRQLPAPRYRDREPDFRPLLA